jgi:hypothetical protein
MQFTVVGFVLLAFVVFTSLKNYFFSDRIPGPLAGRLTKFYRIWLCLGGDGPLRYYDLSRQYGAVVRTGPNHISLFDSELIPVVYDFRNKFKKVRVYMNFNICACSTCRPRSTRSSVPCTRAYLWTPSLLSTTLSSRDP